MSCPACGAALAAAQERCAGCGAILKPPVEGALAAEPRLITPPARAKGEAIREIPALRKREKTWKDEVRERVRQRKRKRGEGDDLPLFKDAESPEAGAAPAGEGEEGAEARETAKAELPETVPIASGPTDLGPPPIEDQGPAFDLPPGASDIDEGPHARPILDLPPVPLEARVEAPTDASEPDLELQPEPRVLRFEEPPASLGDSDGEWRDDEPLAGVEVAPERPARFAERIEAGAVDALVLGGLSAIVIYFASRAAQVDVAGLLPAAPWLVGYLGLLSLAYAAWFTGTTGQTPGKMLFGLRVVDPAGAPPAYSRAMLRAALGAALNACAGLGIVPLFFDPARRALHDRLLKTRVVKF